MRAEPSTPAAAAPASSAISATPWEAICRARSATPESAPGTAVAFAQTPSPLAVSDTAPSFDIVTSARSDAFCSSTLRRLVQQEPEQPCVVACEGDRMIHETPTMADVGHEEGQL